MRNGEMRTLIPTSYLWIPIETGWHLIHAGYIRGNRTSWIETSHQNPNYQIVVTTGDLRFQRDQDRYTFADGGFLLLMPNQMHCSWGPDDLEGGFYFAQMRTSLPPVVRKTPPLLSEKGPSIHVTHAALPDLAQLRRFDEIVTLFESLVHIHQSQELYHQTLANGLLAQIVALIAKDCLHHPPEPADGAVMTTANSQLTANQMKIIDHAIDFIEKNLDQPMNASDISDHLNLSYKYVARVFKAGMGMSLIEYINLRRIHKARFLLLEGNQTIAEIAHAVGFSDPYYFSRIFKSNEGVSPSVFRQSAYVPER